MRVAGKLLNRKDMYFQKEQIDWFQDTGAEWPVHNIV
jgi:hypothetical protein